MTTYYSNKYTPGGALLAQPRFLPSAGGVNVLAVFSLTAALAQNDIIQMLQVAPNASGINPQCIGALLDVDKLDNGGTPAIQLDVGTTGTAQAFFAAVNTAQAGGYTTPNIAGALGFTFPAVDTVQVKVHTGPQSGATSGKVRLLFEYTFDP